ncbi:LPXTG-motif cell wall anchor domain-containing protein [Ignavigranum ruoffiae]|uniref:LPXTG-motif cell wall anchor domain-containing protein n=1 Tax=Ignavigranum ruoffiae TaxID=89093 RepID=A0A1H8Z5G9_9LACT|nr:LPXTG cell wall anchor domain-containing protein [Ignavigranum ruoffiae]UPQ85486.1 LPXTG cell wall anchor domain-containing protein [Ignavigranum ruoffiae]SEP59612.1 LPXTG-motif cell wall anchor domain-containing protein [Ignavigranum ruoffiae]
MGAHLLLAYFQQLMAMANLLLPATGEGNNLVMIIVGVVIVIAAIALFVSGRKKK